MADARKRRRAIPRRPLALGALAAVAASALAAGAAFGAGETITASTGSDTFTQPTFTIDQGTLATFANPASTSHNVIASGRGPDGRELFTTDTIDNGQAPVNGTQYLTAGTYPFVCTIHTGMAAQLVVTGNGTPAARPDVQVKVLSGKIGKVVSSRKLKVKLTAATQSDGVSVTARKGARKLASKSGVDLAAGASRTLKLHLTSAGRNALEGRKSAKVKVTGAVPFGAPDTAKRKLR